VIEDHRGLWNGSSKIGEFGELVVVVPGVESEAESTQHSHSVAEIVARIEPLGRSAGDAQGLGMRISGARVADAPKQSLAGLRVSLENFFDVFAAGEVGVGHDAGYGCSPWNRRTGDGDLGDELGLADRAQMLGSVVAIARSTLDEDGLLDVVARARVGVKIGEEIRRAASVSPQVVMRIDDASTGIEDVFAYLGEPVGVLLRRHSLSLAEKQEWSECRSTFRRRGILFTMSQFDSKLLPRSVSRRTALLVLGAAAAAPALETPIFGLPGYHPQVPAVEEDAAWQPRYLDEVALRTMGEVAELIVPETDTPGAKAALVHQYVDFVLSREETERDAITQGLEWLETQSRSIGDVSFVDLDTEARVALLTRVSAAEVGPDSEEAGRVFFAAAKRLTIRGYYRSEIGMHAELGYEGNRYLPEFPGCTHPEHHEWRPNGAGAESEEKD